jgi:two-component sensor histidine kinase
VAQRDGRLVTAELAADELGILADLRASLRALLSEHTTEPPPTEAAEAAEAAELVLTELASNAPTHGAPAGAAHLQLTHGQLRIAVTDHNPAPPSRSDEPSSAGEPGGRGLDLVERVATAWGATPTPTGKTVWAGVSSRRCN